MTLKESRGPIDEAVRRLLDRERADRPFVLCESGARFVQFAGSRSEVLLIDCPPLDMIAQPCGLDNAAEAAVTALRAQGVQDEDTVTIREGSQPDGGDGALPELAFA